MTYLQVLDDMVNIHIDKYKNNEEYFRKIKIIDGLIGELSYYDEVLRSRILSNIDFLKLKTVLTQLDRDEKLKKILE